MIDLERRTPLTGDQRRQWSGKNCEALGRPAGEEERERIEEEGMRGKRQDAPPAAARTESRGRR